MSVPDHPEWGVTYWDLGLVPILDGDGETELYLFTLKDVTAHRRAARALEASLHEKETLLREIHHRVKNNLQIISSFIHFQSHKLGSGEDSAALSELRQRLSAIILVHDQLFRSRELSRVDFAAYVRALTRSLHDSVGADPRVGIDVESDDVRLPIESALPTGMILCELVTNAFKYAYPDDHSGRVTIRVIAQDDILSLAVDDDGVGFPAGVDPMSTRSFGWQLVRRLVAQIGGEFRVDGLVDAATNRGVHVQIQFAMPPQDGATEAGREGTPG